MKHSTGTSRAFFLSLILASACLSACGNGASDAPPSGVGNAPQTNPPVILDVSSAEEYSSSHLSGAVNISLSTDEWETQITLLDRTSQYRLYCRTSACADAATEHMQGLGFVSVENLGDYDAAKEKTGASTAP